jgi:hypothetical protein
MYSEYIHMVHRLTMHSSSLWLYVVKPSKKPKHIPSPVQARQGVFLWGTVQERLECEKENSVRIQIVKI